MADILWSIKVKRVSPITGKTGWHNVLKGQRKQRPFWTSRQEAYEYAVSHHGILANRSKLVAVMVKP